MIDDKDKVFINLTKVPLSSEIKEMKEKKKQRNLCILLCILCLIMGTGIGILIMDVINPVMNADTTNTLGQIEAVLNKYWLYKNDYENLKNELEDKAFYGMTSFEEDKYTTYMSKAELDDFSTSINMDYVGIGIMYSLRDDYALVERVYIDSPAEKAGMLTGDRITHIDGVSVDGLTTSDIKAMVIGEKDSEVIISVRRDNQDLDLSIIRGEVDNSVYCYTNDNYIVMELESFGSTTGKDIMSYLDNYKDYKSIIIDLRDNTGGYQTSVKEIAGLFIGNDEVYLQQVDNANNVTMDKTSSIKTYDFDKIVLLVNKNTASAAEVFTICLKEKLDNVIIVGNTTYGKGVIQSTRSLNNGGALKYTSYYWLSPNGNSINGVGVKPDIEIDLDPVRQEYYIEMDDEETYEYDSVSDIVKVCEECLKYLDYDISRCDGLFDESFLNALISFKSEHNLGNEPILDKETYETIISNLLVHINDADKDYQMLKAIEIINQ